MYRARYTCLIILSTLLISCGDSAPSDELMQRQIANLLIRDTMGKLFEVQTVRINNATANETGEYIVDASYTLKYTNTMGGYMAYLFEKTNIDSRIDRTGVENDVRTKLEKKYGHPQIDATHDFQDRFTFRKEALGWQVQSPRDYSAIQPFLNK